MEPDDLLAPPVSTAGRVDEERRLADALDAASLTSDEAEQVIHRALELEAEAVAEPHLFSAEQLERIAAEIDMDVAFVRQALGEVRLAPGTRGRLDRFVLPEPITAVESVDDIGRVDLDAIVQRWLIEHEGLLAAAALDDGGVWVVDRRFAARMRTARTTGGNRISRTGAGEITQRVHSLTAEEHVVALQSEGEGPLLLGKLGLALAGLVALIGIASGIAAGSFIDFLQQAASALVMGAAIGAASVAGARRWATGIRRALRRSLTGLGAVVDQRRRSGHRPDLKPVVTDLLKGLGEQVRRRRARRAGRQG